MKQLIGVALACALTLFVMLVPAVAITVTQTNSSGPETALAAMTPSVSTNPSSAREHAPGHGTTPPGQGGEPPGQAKKAEPGPDAADPTGLLGIPDNNFIFIE